MCGIFAYIGPNDPTQVCLSGLKKLEYRGYDSAGLAGLLGSDFHTCKEVGKIASFEEALKRSFSPSLKLDSAIAHTRWATHGRPNVLNAHPHFDEAGKIAIVHNGIVENHEALRSMLKKEGRTFQTETDTEVVVQLISYFYAGDLLLATQKALSLMTGFWGLAILHKDHPDIIVCAAKENPLAIAIDSQRKACYISSDPNAFDEPELDVYFLKNNEVALVHKGHIDVFDPSSAPVSQVLEKLSIDTAVKSKGDFDHFMLKEIFEQPQTITQAMHSRFLEEFGTAEFEGLAFSLEELQRVKRILILGCGTSWHAGSLAALLFEEKARIPTQTEIASEFRYKNPILSEDTLVIAISQSGETLDTIAAVREVKRKGAKVLAICNVRHSTLTREADGVLFLRAGPEISVCSTKAFTSQLTTLSLFALLLGRLHHVNQEDGRLFLQQLRALPSQVQEILDRHEEIKELAKKYATFNHFFFLGRHYMFPASLEAALKLKEISYLYAAAYPAGEMKHGPIALVSPELAVVGLLASERAYEKSLSNLAEVRARGAEVLAFAFEDSPGLSGLAHDVFTLPRTSDSLAPILVAVATQLFAYYVACERGNDIDQPRNLAKSVTVE